MATTDSKKRKIVERILAKYSEGKYSIKSICSNEGVDYKTFRKWEAEIQNSTNPKTEEIEKQNSTKPEPANIETSSQNFTKEIPPIPPSYEEAKEKVREKRKGALMDLAISALELHLVRQEWDEVKKVGEQGKDGTLNTKRLEVTKKFRDPNPMLVKFTLENMDPNTFKTRAEVTLTEKNPWIQLMETVKLKKNESGTSNA